MKWLRAGPRGVRLSVGGLLVVDPRLVEEYWLDGDKRILSDLTRLSRPEDAVDFVRRWGLIDPHPPSQPTWQESVDRFLQEAEGLRELMSLHDLIMRTLDCEPEARRSLRAIIAIFGAPGQFVVRDERDDVPLINSATEYFARRINAARRGIERSMVPVAIDVDRIRWLVTEVPRSDPLFLDVNAPGAHLVISRSPTIYYQEVRVAPSLTSYAYDLWASTLADLVELRRCEGCGARFQPRDPRQTYCDTTCGDRSRKRRELRRRRDR